jgi:hypothetical protein
MSGKFTISANVLQAVLNKLGERPYVEVEGIINAIRKDVQPLPVVQPVVEEAKKDKPKNEKPKEE